MGATALTVLTCDSIDKWADKAREFYSLLVDAKLPGVIYMKVNLHVQGYDSLHTLEYGIANDKSGIYCTCWENIGREARAVGEISLRPFIAKK